jgi:hypothetical protein
MAPLRELVFQKDGLFVENGSRLNTYRDDEWWLLAVGIWLLAMGFWLGGRKKGVTVGRFRVIVPLNGGR